MKTIVETASGLSKYLIPDDVDITANADHIVVGEPPQLIVADLNADNSVVYVGVTAPIDWTGDKYIFDDGEWLPNPDFEAEPS